MRNHASSFWRQISSTEKNCTDIGTRHRRRQQLAKCSESGYLNRLIECEREVIHRRVYVRLIVLPGSWILRDIFEVVNVAWVSRNITVRPSRRQVVDFFQLPVSVQLEAGRGGARTTNANTNHYCSYKIAATCAFRTRAFLCFVSPGVHRNILSRS